MLYLCYFLDAKGRCGDRKDLHAPNDETAMQFAREEYEARKEHPRHGFELWQGTRCTYAEMVNTRSEA